MVSNNRLGNQNDLSEYCVLCNMLEPIISRWKVTRIPKLYEDINWVLECDISKTLVEILRNKGMERAVDLRALQLWIIFSSIVFVLNHCGGAASQFQFYTNVVDYCIRKFSGPVETNQEHAVGSI